MVYGEVLCPFIHYSIFIEPLQGIGTIVGSMDTAIEDISFPLNIEDWSVEPEYTDGSIVAKYNQKSRIS